MGNGKIIEAINETDKKIPQKIQAVHDYIDHVFEKGSHEEMENIFSTMVRLDVLEEIYTKKMSPAEIFRDLLVSCISPEFNEILERNLDKEDVKRTDG